LDLFCENNLVSYELKKEYKFDYLIEVIDCLI